MPNPDGTLTAGEQAILASQEPMPPLTLGGGGGVKTPVKKLPAPTTGFSVARRGDGSLTGGDYGSLITQAINPSTLADVATVDRSGYTTKKAGPLSGFDGIDTFKNIGSSSSFDDVKYFRARMTRMGQIAEKLGVTGDAKAQLMAQVQGSLAQLDPALSGGAAHDAMDAALNQWETDLVASNGQIPGLTTADPNAPVSQAEVAKGAMYTPQEQAAIQAQIGKYMTPLIDQMQGSGKVGADTFALYAGQPGADPATKALATQQAAQMRATTDRTAAAYMAQAQALPAINALQGQQQLAAQVTSLQNQLAQYQMAAQQPAAGGEEDFGAMLQAAMGTETGK